MQRVLQFSKQLVIGIFTLSLGRSIVRGWSRLTSFARLHEDQLNPEFNFQALDTYLFLPERYAAKTHFYVETIVMSVLLGLVGCVVVLGTATLFATSVIVVLSGAIALFYLAFMVFKLWVIRAALVSPFTTVAEERVAALQPETLPVYTVLVPLRNEAAVMEQIVTALSALDYPADKLDLIITVEQADLETKAAIDRVGLPSHWRVLELPDTGPKTKPKAMNCAFLQARGEYVVIYDAEIIPDPDQLKKAVVAFADHPNIAVFQPRLDHYNSYQNLLTRLFTIEFTFHYDLFLPGLSKFQLPVPLSGHSTHFRMAALRDVGAWDPFNVAEDCEIGMRLFRRGYRSSVLDSVSREEAASTLRGWIQQRTRWMKGFIQTSIVHLRYPRLTVRTMGGWRNFSAFLLLIPGTVLVNILNIFGLFALGAWLFFQPSFVQELYPQMILYTANFVAILGGFTFVYLHMIALYRRNKFSLVRWWFFIPVYWLLLAYATLRAIKQIFTQPHLWEKTTHGTHLNS